MANFPASLPKLSRAFHRESGPVAVARALNATNDEVMAVASALGLNPAGSAASVAARIAAVEATSSGSGSALADSLASVWHPYIARRPALAAASAAAGVYLFSPGSSTAGPLLATAGTANAATAPFYIKGADFPAYTGKVAKMRIRGSLITNAVAPANTFTFGLRPVSTWGGASAASPFPATVGAEVSNGAAQVVTPAAAGPAAPVESGSFAVPADGWYVLTVTLSGVTAAGAVQAVFTRLDARYE